MSEANEHPYKKITSTEPNLLNEHQQYIAQAEHHSLRQPNVKNFTEASYHPKFTWELCTTDPDNTENILVWRSISRMTPEDAIQNGNLSYRARNQAVVNPEMRSRETFIKQFDGQDISKIAENYVMVSGVKHDEPSPVLHTTYDPKNVSFVPHEGVIMEFSVPKQWILDHESETFVTTGLEGAEDELAFFHSLPEKTIKSITYEDENKNKIVETPAEIKNRIKPEPEQKPLQPREELIRFTF